ncbi:MAG: hypothetical protein A3E05_01325 [Candidatus Jacksonbacteria bacterium RIFCSPHIGHO2_12_FULL_44_12]|nr:MAG: hypothetical protein A3E05_01325 [Candidatus Jacksonbacteria bacterium RIFCSPHIGHO2_12_FULL_44_12]
MQQSDHTIEEVLKTIGLSEKEAQVYLGLLELGRGTVSAVARRAGINRTSGYHLLDSIIAKGLVSVSGKEPKQEYVAESPDKIIALLKKQLEADVARLKAAEELVPQLKSLHNVTNRPRVRFYEGKEGLMQVYEDTLTSHEPILAYATFEDMHRTLPNYFPLYYKRRAAKGIYIRGIVPDTEMARERIKHNQKEKREVALIPADKFYFSPEINIYDNKVMIASWREKLGIIIESDEIADAMKKIYELAWVEAKRLDEKKSDHNPLNIGKPFSGLTGT